MIYVLMFVGSLLLFNIALKFRFTNKKVFVLFSLIALVLPCFLAGVRDYSIGTDVNLYVEPLYRVSKCFSHFFDFVNMSGSEVNDYGYLFLTFICGKLSNDIFLLFFLSELLVIAPIYKSLLNMTDKSKPILYGIFIFYMVLYNLSFNMVRQSIAIAFSILSFTYFLKKKNLKSILSLIIAFCFHSSSIIMLTTFILSTFFESRKSNSKDTVGLRYLIVIILILVVILFPNIIRMLINLGLLNAKHFSRLLGYYNNIDINFVRTAWYIAFYLLFLLNKGKLSKNLSNSYFYSFLSFISIIILQLGAVVQFSERIGYYYFFITLILGVPFMCFNNNSDNSIKRKSIINLIVIFIFFSYWFYWSIYIGSNQTYPFVFRV